jgi:hypothetical protein
VALAAARTGTAILCFAGVDIDFTGAVVGFGADFFVFFGTLAGPGAALRADGFAAVRLGAFPGAGFGRGADGRAGFRRDGAASLAAVRTAGRAGTGLVRRVAGRVRFIAPSSDRGS